MRSRPRLRRTLKNSFVTSLALIFACTATSAGRGNGLDLVVNNTGFATGEIGAQFDLGPLRVQAEHKEYLAYLNQAGDGDPVTRRSRLGTSGSFDLGEGVSIPLGLNGEYQQSRSGQQDLDVSLESGLNLPQMRVGTRFFLEQDLSAESDAGQALGGDVTVGFDWMGARHEGGIGYDVFPSGQLTELVFGSHWPLNNGFEATLDFTHEVLESRSEARIGLDQRFGPFVIGSDLSADSAGGYTLGFTLSLNLGPAPKAQEWRLSSLLSALQGSRGDAAVRDSFGIPAFAGTN
ncbi:hypothetical protein HBA54_01480 [Pelagibius litoralis]|uniref:MetA-pathway of phenol degradation n=1 Tax=Pelagibius litoralis TaxID=374515 RepID=A0A967C9W8_9PROT|nr:hypothetical protein [Pelagibius litoralis]NIA67258.1 hypothetical protein [Pelagibius litoralis]